MLIQTNSCKSFLAEELQRRIKVNPRYSQRAFARQMGMSPGEMSEVLRGKRNLSLKSAFRVIESLGLNQEESKHLLELVQLEKSQSAKPTQGKGSNIRPPVPIGEYRRNRQLDLDSYHVVADWYCFAILSLLECDDVQHDEKWIAQRMGLSTAEVRIALERLERVGLIRLYKTASGQDKIDPIDEYVLSPQGTPSKAIRNYHRSMLTKAAESLEMQNVNEREFSGVNFAIDASSVKHLKTEISDFLDKMVEKYCRGSKKEVYHLEVALFRLTKGEKG